MVPFGRGCHGGMHWEDTGTDVSKPLLFIFSSKKGALWGHSSILHPPALFHGWVWVRKSWEPLDTAPGNSLNAQEQKKPKI